ncbi:MAG: TIGR04372 family glycosyltransferase [Candidatus Omnitrophica bacterium]|nr:TIGR04372 family glycosyltransferase [Candidatus Omnitrophota bacterium]
MVVKQRLVSMGGYGWALIAPVWWLARLLAGSRLLRRADVVVVASRIGFAHVVAAADITRRMFRGRRCVLVVLSEHERHNRKIARLWPDVTLLFLPVNPALAIGRRSWAIPYLDWFRPVAHELVQRIVRRMVRPDAMVLSQVELYAMVPIPGPLPPALSDLPVQHRWCAGYVRLQEEVAAPRVQVPTKWRRLIEERLRGLTPPGTATAAVRRCGLYLRQVAADSNDLTSVRRDGSPFEDYVPAIRLLARAGFQVLLVGEVALDRRWHEEFRGMLVDARRLGVDPAWFDLYAGTEVDLFIGENGGGSWLPGLNGIPRLLLNVFPYYPRPCYLGMAHTWLYYKTVRDASGQPVSHERLCAEHAYDYGVSGMTLHNNSAQEIAEAVEEFLQHASAEGSSSLEAWIDDNSAKLSPVWVRRDRGAEGQGSWPSAVASAR